MKILKLLYLTCLMTALLGLVPGGPIWASDGGDDGGFDDGGFDGGGDDNDDGQDHHDGEHDHGHHHDHHHDHLIVHHTGWGPWGGFGPGFGFGTFGYMPPFYPSPYYAYPPLAAQPPRPPVYIQQQNAAQPAPESQTNYWHYCRASAGYYPQVQECPEGWQQVAPQPPPPPPEPPDSQG